MRTMKHIIISILIILSSLLIHKVSSTLTYPVTIGGFSGSTVLEGFTIDNSGNLGIEAISSDTQIVSAANTNVAMYFPQTASTWLWAKQVTTGQTLLEIKIRASDGLRLMLLYQSSLLIVLSTVDGSLILAQTSSQFNCALGCTTLYDSATLNLFGVVTFSGQEYLGISNFNPDSGLAASSIIGISSPPYLFRFPKADSTSDSRIMLGAQSIPSYSIFLGMPSSFAQIDFIFQELPNTLIRGIKYYTDGTNKRVFAYMDDLTTPNQFYYVRYIIDTTLPTSDIYHAYQATSTTSIQFLAFEAFTIHNSYSLIYYTSTHQVVVVNSYGIAGTSNTYNSVVTSLVTTTLPLSLANGYVFTTGPQFYVGGNNAQDIFSQSLSGGTLPATAFVYSFQNSESQIPIPASIQIDSTNDPNAPGGVQVQIAVSQSFASLTIPSTSVAVAPSDFVVPIYSTTTPPTCETQLTETGYPTSVNYYIGDVLSNTIVPPSIAQCAGITCSTLVTLSVSAPDLVFTYNQGTSISSFSTVTTSRDGQTVSILLTYIFPSSYFSSCGLQFSYQTMTIVNPIIVPSVISSFIYNLGSPTFPVTITPFTNNKGITGDSKLAIVYQLKKSDGTSYSPGVVSNFNSATVVISVQTTDATLPRTNAMQIVAYFAYNPLYTVTVPFTITLEKCFQTVIYMTPPTQMIYQIGQPALTQITPAWTDLYQSECGSFTFTVTFPLCPAITISVPTFTVQTAVNSLDGLYPVTITGTLNQPVTNTVYKSATASFNIILFNPAVTFITPQFIDSATYVLKDPTLNIPVSPFPSSKAYLTVQYELLNFDNSAYDNTLFTFDQVGMQILVSSIDPTKVGVYQLIIKAYFATTAPYFVTSSFTVTVLHQCTRNIITSSVIPTIQYNVATSALTQQAQTWTLSMPECAPMVFTAVLQNGKSLPSIIKFAAASLSFTVFTPLIKDVGTYQIKIKGTTQYYSPVSQIQSTFSVIVNCVPLTIQPQDKGLSYKFAIGSQLPLTIQFQSFTYAPICSGQSVTYTALLDGNPLPSYIQFDSLKNTLTVVDDGSLITGSHTITVKGQVTAQAQATLQIQLSIIQGNANTLGAHAIQLPAIVLNAVAGVPSTYQSTSFASYTKQTYSMIVTDASLTFIKLKSQQLSITPQAMDVGMHQVLLSSQTDGSNIKYTAGTSIVQTVSINVGPGSGQKTHLEVGAIISSISNSGLVTIDFNQEIGALTNVTQQVNQSALQLLVTDKSGLYQPSITFNWTATKMYRNQPSTSKPQAGFSGSRLLIQILFDNPQDVSQNVTSYSQCFRDTTIQQSKYQIDLSLSRPHLTLKQLSNTK